VGLHGRLDVCRCGGCLHPETLLRIDLARTRERQLEPAWRDSPRGTGKPSFRPPCHSIVGSPVTGTKKFQHWCGGAAEGCDARGTTSYRGSYARVRFPDLVGGPPTLSSGLRPPTHESTMSASDGPSSMWLAWRIRPRARRATGGAHAVRSPCLPETGRVYETALWVGGRDGRGHLRDGQTSDKGELPSSGNYGPQRDLPPRHRGPARAEGEVSDDRLSMWMIDDLDPLVGVLAGVPLPEVAVRVQSVHDDLARFGHTRDNRRCDLHQLRRHDVGLQHRSLRLQQDALITEDQAT